jgi:thiamine pyrophosphokinase
MEESKVLLILNTPINFDIEKYWFDPLVKYRICADGGANQLNDYNKKKINPNPFEGWLFIEKLIFLLNASLITVIISSYNPILLIIFFLILFLYRNKNKRNSLVPDLIIGDMDSYSGFDSRVIKIEDKDTTDFTKCIRHIENNLRIINIIVIGGYGGRFDHECGNMQTIAKSKCHIIMIDKDNYVCKINIGSNNFECNGYCGLIPLTKSKIKTEGFTWNVDQEIEFGGLISTSNHAIGPVNVNLKYGLCLFWKSNL